MSFSRQRNCQLKLTSALAGAFIVLGGGWADAQIIPDGTLGRENSIVTPNSQNLQMITGGATRGTNLFHSFQQFSVLTGQTAYFNNLPQIQNIFSRVTGGAISNIDGLLRTNGTASLFLLNPNGIIFGQNASLDLGGSFFATTANSILFDSSTHFSARNATAVPLLTVSVPVGLGFGSNPGTIRVEGTGHSITRPHPIFGANARGDSLTGLRVPTGNTLALIGGDVFLVGGVVAAPSGRIELGSVSDGVVSLNSQIPGVWTLGYENVTAFKDIQLSRLAAADASGSGLGAISVQGRQVSVRDGSAILIQNSGMQPSGDLSVNAAESLLVSGTAPDLRIRSIINNETLAGGLGGNIAISTPQLVIDGAAIIYTTTFSAARAGNVIINAKESVQVSGTSPLNPNFFSNLISLTYGSGNAGNVMLDTQKLTVEGGSVVGSVTFGSGNGGNVNVFATDFIELIGASPITFQASALTTSTLNAGDAGDLRIDTSRLLLRDGGRVSASNLATGNAGSVIINATNSVEISGTTPDSVLPSGVASSTLIVNKTLQQLFRLPPVPSGNSGDVIINTPLLSVANSGAVTVRNEGTGRAGDISIRAGEIFLANGGGITAATASGEGGNIALQTRNLQLRSGSNTSATAGGMGNGGNVTLNSDTIIALENSNITANAVRGNGGNIQISTQGIFIGDDSEIAASSQLGVNGVVEVRTVGLDFKNALTPVTNNFVSIEEAIAGSCLARRNIEQGKFTVSGTGGLAPTPYDAASLRYTLTEVKPISSSAGTTSTSTADSTTAPWKIGDPIIEAQSIVKTPDGRVLLVAMPQGEQTANPQTVICHR